MTTYSFLDQKKTKQIVHHPEINDETIIHFGIHQGKALIDIPDDYLLWLYNNDKAGKYEEYILETIINAG